MSSNKQSKKVNLLRGFDDVESIPSYMTNAKKPLRVLLIQPSSEGGVVSLLPQIDDNGEGIGFKPPLGILYIASTIKEQSDHEVMVIDAMAERLNFDSLIKQVIEFAPDVVGISAWTDFWYPAWRTGQLIKSALPTIHLTYGGPHVGIFAEETLKVPFIDSVIVGDGEIPFLYLCNMLSHGRLDNSLPGLHITEGGVKPQPDTFFIQKDLDSLPIPDRTLLPVKNYGSVLSRGDYVTTMVTSRGCPHKCTFCKLNFQKTLCRSAESVIEEFRQIRDMGIREVEIYDDTFTWSKKRLREICDGLIAEKIDVEWAVRDRVSSADPDLLKLMAKAGCRRIHFGIESGVQSVIDTMKKRITLDQARNAIRYAKDAKMTVLTYWMFGNPDETLQDMRDTIAFSKELDADYAEFSITIPYAGTEMYTTALADGTIQKDYWKSYALEPIPDFCPPELIETHSDFETLKRVQRDAVRSYYFRPKYLLRELTSLDNFAQFIRKAKMGARLFNSVYVK